MTDATTLESVSSDKGAAPANLDLAANAAAGNQPTDVEIKIGEKTVKVSPEIAAELAASREAAKEAGLKVGTLSQQMTEINAKLEALTKPATNKATEPGLDVLLFTDPDKAVAQITENILAQVRGENTKTASQRQFWEEFYKENKELKEYEGYVQYVFNRELPNFTKQNMTVGDSLKKLGEITKGELLKLRGKQPNVQKPAGEGGSESGNSRSGSGSDRDVSEDSQTSTASILSERREARRNAKQPGRRAK
jgi:hypothetical protein